MKSQSRARIGAQSAQQLKIAVMSFDERKTFAATKEDPKQNTVDIPVFIQRQVLVGQKAQRTADIPLLQYSDTTVDVPVAKDSVKTPQKQHEDCMTRSALLGTENKRQTFFDNEGRRGLRLRIRYKKVSRIMRCVSDIECTTEDGCSQTKLTSE